MTDDGTTRTEEFQVAGDRLMAEIKRLVREGNIRRIIIKNEGGKALLEIPLTYAAVGAVLLPVFAAVGALAALVTKCTIAIERIDPATSPCEPAEDGRKPEDPPVEDA